VQAATVGVGVASVAVGVGGVKVRVIVSSGLEVEKLISRERNRRARTESGIMWYFISHLVFLGVVGATLSFLGFPTFMMPVSPLGILLATALTLLAYHLMQFKDEDVSFDVVLCLIADMLLLVLSPSIYAFWFAEKNVMPWLWWDKLVTFRSLLVSMAVTATQALLPLVYLKYVRTPVYAEALAPPPVFEEAEAKPVEAKPTVGKAKMKLMEYRPYTVEWLGVQEVVVALDISGRPIYSLAGRGDRLLTAEERAD
jgi:hypothetical protein